MDVKAQLEIERRQLDSFAREEAALERQWREALAAVHRQSGIVQALATVAADIADEAPQEPGKATNARAHARRS